MSLPTRATHSLSHHRVSTPGATYFLTLTSSDRKNGLTSPQSAESIKDALRNLHRAKDFNLHCATIMPDHLHLLGVLGDRLTLSQTLAKLKVVTKKSLQAAKLAWHRNYYDHRLRQKTNTDSFARYIFLNPYRRRLLPATAAWPHWILNKNYRPEFLEQLEPDQLPPARWLETLPSLPDIIEADLP